MRRKILWGLLTLGLLLGGWAISGRIEAGRRWAALDREARAWTVEADRRDAARPTFHADAQPGDAWNDYERALKAYAEQPFAPSLSLEFPTERGLDDLLNRAGPVLEGLRKGTRKRSCRIPLTWDVRAWGGKGTPSKLDPGYLALLTARRLDGDEGLDLLLDAALYARDFSNNTWIGHEHNALQLLKELCDEIQARTLTDAQASRVAKALEAVDDGFPPEGLSAINTLAILVIARSEGLDWREIFGSVKIPGSPPSPGLRFKFSGRLMEVDAFERTIALARRTMKADSLEEARRIAAEAEALPAENGCASLLRMPHVERHRRALAQVRLLRSTVVWKSTGAVLALADPFGHEGGRLIFKEGRFWSLGSDGNGLTLDDRK